MSAKNVLQRALAKLSLAERDALARKLGTNREALRVLATGYRTGGKLNIEPVRAGQIEGLLGIPREKICTACAKCDILKLARKGAGDV